MFSRQFSQEHPRAGEPTYFVEKLIQSFLLLDLLGYHTEHIKRLRDLGYLEISKIILDPMEKHHTIRAGHRFKKGDKFSPRVWAGKPYRSKQVILGPDVEVANTWNFEVDENGICSLNGRYILSEHEGTEEPLIEEIAKNDGLSTKDFVDWIIQPAYRNHTAFFGQIITWNPKLEYIVPDHVSIPNTTTLNPIIPGWGQEIRENSGMQLKLVDGKWTNVYGQKGGSRG